VCVLPKKVPAAKIGRKLKRDAEEYKRELNHDKDVLEYTATTVTCVLCDLLIDMRREYYLYYWTDHKRSRRDIRPKFGTGTMRRQKLKRLVWE
jgi:hypothetical protein